MRNSEKDLRIPPESPTSYQPQNPAMDRLRARIAAELAALNPSAVAGTAAKRLHGDVERRLLALVSALRTPTHPPYASMVHRAIEELNEGGGSSEKAISEFIVKEYENLPLGHDGILRHHLGKLCQRGEVLCRVDGRYCLQVDGGAVTAVKKGVVGVERKSQKKRRGRKWGVSRLRGVKDRGVEETKNGEIGEENPWIELEIEGQTKAKEGRKGEASRPSGVKDPGVEETKGGEIGKENGWIEQEIEGQTEAREMSNDRINEEKKGKEEREELVRKLDKGNKEKNVAVKEQSEAERQDMEVTEEQIQMTGKKLNDGGPNDEEILQAFINAKAQANEKKEDIEVGEQQRKTIQEQQLGISSEQIEPQPEQIEVIERQGGEEVQKKQQEKAKLNNKTISASPLNEENIEAGEQQAEMIEEQKLGISSEPKEIQPQQAKAIEKQISLEEVRKQHQDCCGQQDITQEERGITSMPTPTTPLVGASIDGQQVNLEKQSARKKKRSVPQQQDLHQSQLQRRKLRSFARSSNPESATSSTSMELSPFSQLHDELQQQALHEGQEKQDQQRPPKQKRDENSNMQTELALDSHPYYEKQPPKRRRVRGMPLNPTQDAEAIKEASSVQLQNKQQHNQAQLPRRVLRSHNKEPSIPESAKPTMAFSFLPSEKQDMQRQQSQCQGRPPKQKIDVDTNAASVLSLASKHHKEDLPLKDHGRRTSPGHTTDTDTDVREGSTVSLASQHHEEDKQPPKQHCRGRTSNLKTDTTLNAGSALSSALLDHRGEDEEPPKPHGQGGPSQHHAEEKQFTDLNAGSALYSDSQHHEEAMEQPPKRMGRPPNPIPSAYMLKRYGQGKPSKPKPSAYMGKRHGQGSPPIPKASARMLRKLIRTANMLKRDGRGRPPNPMPSEYMMKKYGEHQLRGKGGGKPSKAKQEAKSNADVILPSNTRLEKLKQKHTKGRGPGRPPKAK